VCVCVYTHTHKHSTNKKESSEPRGGDETPAGPEKSAWTKSQHIFIRVCVQSMYAYVYARRWDKILD